MKNAGKICYRGGMKKTKVESNPNERVSPNKRDRHSLTVVLSSYKSQIETMNDWVIQAALRYPIWVLDMGNCFDPLRLVRPIRRRTVQIQTVLERIRGARAFTCFQVVSLLGQTQNPEGQIFILDLLTTFSDEVIPAQNRNTLLRQMLFHIHRLRQSVPIVLTTGNPRHLEALPVGMLNYLKKQASQVIAVSTPVNPQPATLF